MISTHPTDDFTVRVQTHEAAVFPACFLIGFVTRETFEHLEPSKFQDGVYTLHPKYGELFGTGHRGKRYCKDAGFRNGTIRCVADRIKRTIVFHVDGKSRAVAWKNVTAAPLYAIAMIDYPQNEVTLI